VVILAENYHGDTENTEVAQRNPDPSTTARDTPCRLERESLTLSLIKPLTSRHFETEVCNVLQQLWDSFIMLVPVFFLLTMIFGAGFYIGRVSKKE
jgi:hypothetical protein